jgi:hypothetical protein
MVSGHRTIYRIPGFLEMANGDINVLYGEGDEGDACILEPLLNAGVASRSAKLC